MKQPSGKSVTAVRMEAVHGRHARGPVSALAAVALLAMLIAGRLELPDMPLCWFHLLTGLPCPGCGLTRSVCAIGRGDFAVAWQCNPFGYVVYGVLVVLLLSPVLARVAPKLTALLESNRFIHVFAVVNFTGLMVFGLVRLVLLWN